MKYLDELLSELQEPISQLIDWCKDDQDRAIVACLRDLLAQKDVTLFEVISEAKPDFDAADIMNWGYELFDEISYLGYVHPDKPAIDYEALYLPLEHIINERIDLYNRS